MKGIPIQNVSKNIDKLKKGDSCYGRKTLGKCFTAQFLQNVFDASGTILRRFPPHPLAT